MRQKGNEAIDRRKLTFTVTCFAPVDAKVGEVKAFIEDNLVWAGGCCYPGDPMFYSLDRVAAKQVRRKKKCHG